MRVLIVDDELELVAALVERLDLRGIHAEGADSGAAALQKVQSGAYDVALVDFKMPGMDGMDLIRLLQKDHPDLKVIMMTGHCDAESQERSKAAGAWDCLVKPVHLDTLLEVLRQAVQK